MSEEIPASPGWVARLYVDTNGKWEVGATGRVRVANLPGKGYCIILITDGEVREVTHFEITEVQEFTHQEDSILRWTDPDGDALSLSFKAAGALECFYDQVCRAQERLRAIMRLPAANRANLNEIHEFIVKAQPDVRRLLGRALLRGFYIDDLFDLATQLEATADMELTFEIFLAILSLNDITLTEYILSVKWLPELIRIFSYDPKVPRHRRIDHKAYLHEKAQLKAVVELPSPIVVELVHHSFMLQYLRDTMLIGILDDVTLSCLSTVILEVNAKIYRRLQSDPDFNKRLMEQIQSCSDVERLRDLAKFMQHYFELPKGVLDMMYRCAFFTTLAENGLFDALQSLLSFPDEAVQQTTVGLLLTTAITIPNPMREYIICKEEQESDYPFMEGLVEGFHTAAGSGEMSQFSELFRHLFDPCSMEEHRKVAVEAADALEGYDEHEDEAFRIETFTWEGKAAFIQLLYRKFLPQIVTPIVEPSDDSDRSHLQWYLKCEIADLLAFCVVKHGVISRFFLLDHNVLAPMLHLLPTAPGTLALAIIRLFRAVIGEVDHSLERFIIHKNLFEPVMQLFRDNAHRYNMVNSAILELINYLSSTESHAYDIVRHLLAKYRDDFEAVTYVTFLDSMAAKLAQYEEEQSAKRGLPNKRGHSDAFSDADDSYFDRLSDDDEPTTPPLDDDNDVDHLEDSSTDDGLPKMPSVKRRRIDEDDDDEDPFASKHVSTHRARSGGISFCWSKPRATPDESKEAPSSVNSAGSKEALSSATSAGESGSGEAASADSEEPADGELAPISVGADA